MPASGRVDHVNELAELASVPIRSRFGHAQDVTHSGILHDYTLTDVPHTTGNPTNTS